jgi:uncharacterized protein (TIGR02246 family)
MADDRPRADVEAAMQRINAAWLGGNLEDLAAVLHPDIVMVFPGFVGRVQGRDALVAGFEDFRDNARLEDFRESEIDIDVAGDTAVVTFLYEMLYERSSQRYRATGRDMWIFERRGPEWLAVWRTMLDVQETPAQ